MTAPIEHGAGAPGARPSEAPCAVYLDSPRLSRRLRVEGREKAPGTAPGPWNRHNPQQAAYGQPAANAAWKQPKSAMVSVPLLLQSAYMLPAANAAWKHPKSAMVSVVLLLQSG